MVANQRESAADKKKKSPKPQAPQAKDLQAKNDSCNFSSEILTFSNFSETPVASCHGELFPLKHVHNVCAYQPSAFICAACSWTLLAGNVRQRKVI